MRILEQDFARKQQQFDAKKEHYWAMVQAGQLTTEQFLQGVRQDRMTALQGYAEGMNMMLDQYQTEQAALAQHAQSIYDAINTQIGLDMAALGIAEQQYQQAIAPSLDKLDAAITGYQAEATDAGLDLGFAEFELGLLEDQKADDEEERRIRRDNWGMVFDAIKTIGSVASTVAAIGG
jgi:hypothetical protein